MPLPPIAVEVAPAPQKPELVQILLDACSRAASPVECVAADQPNLGQPSALAIVVWAPEADSVRLQVGARRGQAQGDWIKRKISFEETDEERERWTATGFIVGTLASRFLKAEGALVTESSSGAASGADAKAARDSAAEAAPAPAPTPKASAEPAPKQDDANSDSSRRRAWIDLAGLAGPVLGQGPWRFGGMLGVAYQERGLPAFGYVALRLSRRPKDSQNIVVSVTEFDFGVGLPVPLAEAWTLNATLGLSFERLLAQWEDPGAEEAEPWWVVGVRARLELGFELNKNLALVGGVGTTWWSYNSLLTINEAPVNQQPTVVGEVSLGFRFQAL